MINSHAVRLRCIEAPNHSILFTGGAIYDGVILRPSHKNKARGVMEIVNDRRKLIIRDYQLTTTKDIHMNGFVFRIITEKAKVKV